MTASPAIDRDPYDHELVGQVIAGSQEALAMLYDRHVSTVFNAALRLGGERGAAEEVVQETFLALWNRAEQFDPSRGSLAAWLATIARNRAIDRRRSTLRRFRAEAFSSVAADRPDEAATVDWLLASGEPVATATPHLTPEAAFAARETQTAVAEAVSVLSDDERQAILLAYRDGLSQSEIAHRLGWPLGTVKTRSRRALRRLRAELEAASAAVVRPTTVQPRARPRPVRIAEPCGGCP